VMYGLENMIDMGLKGSEWTTPDHRVVAISACICNPHVRTRDVLIDNVKIINAIPVEKIRIVTFEDLRTAGCYI